MTPSRLPSPARPTLSLVEPEPRTDDLVADQAPDEVDGLPVAAVLVLTVLGTAGGIGWMWLMHMAGSGKGWMP